MKKLLITASTLILISALFVSCDEDTPDPILPEQNVFTTESLTSLTEGLKTEPATYTINSSQEITTENGTKIRVPSNSLVDANGFTVDFPVDIEIQELYTAGDMIRNNVSTISDGEILVSGGQFNISASKDGAPLSIRSYNLITVEVPATEVDDNMTLFLGGTEDQPEWVEFNEVDSAAYFSVLEESYQISINEFQWINCDYFYSSEEPEVSLEVSANLNEITVGNSAMVWYAYIPELNSMLNVYNGELSNVTVGLTIELFGIAQDENGEMFYALKEHTVLPLESDGINPNILDVELLSVTEEELENILDSM